MITIFRVLGRFGFSSENLNTSTEKSEKSGDKGCQFFVTPFFMTGILFAFTNSFVTAVPLAFTYYTFGIVPQPLIVNSLVGNRRNSVESFFN